MDGEDPGGEPVDFERLVQWDGSGFSPQVEINPNEPTFVLVHGWEGSPQIWEQGQPPVAQLLQESYGAAASPNILAWDWSDASGTQTPADPNGAPDGCLTDAAQLDLLLDGGVVELMGSCWLDALIAGFYAKVEGNALGDLLVTALQSTDADVHLIGHSHGGGLLGAVAAKLQQVSRPASSLTVLDTPNRGLLDSTKYVDPHHAA